MNLRKGLFALLLLVSIIAVILIYLLKPAGKIEDFRKWQYQPTSALANSSLNVKFFGVSTLLFDDGQDQILIDGFFSRPMLAKVIFQRIYSDSDLISRIIRQHDLYRTQAILVTHSHYDHALDLSILGNSLTNAQIIGSNSSLNIARGGEVASSQLTQAEPWKVLHIGKFKITPIPSKHTPPTAVNDDLGKNITAPLVLPARFSDFKEGGSFDYLIENQNYKILVKASTGAIPNQFKNLHVDALFIGVAQLSRQSPEFQTQYLKETLSALNPKLVIPIHWDNFFKPLSQPLQFLPRIADNTPESLKILIQHAEQQGHRVVLLTQPVAYPLAQRPNL